MFNVKVEFYRSLYFGQPTIRKFQLHHVKPLSSYGRSILYTELWTGFLKPFICRNTFKEFRCCLLENLGGPVGSLYLVSPPLLLHQCWVWRSSEMRLHHLVDGGLLAHRGSPSSHHLHDADGPASSPWNNVYRCDVIISLLSSSLPIKSLTSSV